MNAKLKSLFDMSRRERRGTIVLLLLMAVALIVSAIVGMKKEAPPADAVVAVEAFEAETDSSVFTVEKPDRRHHEKRRHPAKRHPSKKSKPTPEKPRRLDPVPQF